MKRVFLISLSMLFLLVCTSCTSGSVTAPPESEEAGEQEALGEESPTDAGIEPTAAPTETPLPTETSTPEPTPTAEPTATPEPTSTPEPTTTEELIPTPTRQPEQARYSVRVYYNLQMGGVEDCDAWDQRARSVTALIFNAGDTLNFTIFVRHFDTVEAAREHGNAYPAIFTFDGVQQNAVFYAIGTGSEGGFENGADSKMWVEEGGAVTLTPGTHTLTATWGPYSGTCTIIVN
jgi:hypothetical protein